VAYWWTMKKRRLAKPKEKIKMISRKHARKLSDRYAELLRLRNEISRLSTSVTKATQSDR
jgi:hypothetical protein